MLMTWEALIVDVVKETETPELLWARVHKVVPHNNLLTTNPHNHEISVPEDRNFFLGEKGAQRQRVNSDKGAKSNWNLVVCLTWNGAQTQDTRDFREMCYH